MRRTLTTTSTTHRVAHWLKGLFTKGLKNDQETGRSRGKFPSQLIQVIPHPIRPPIFPADQRTKHKTQPLYTIYHFKNFLWVLKNHYVHLREGNLCHLNDTSPPQGLIKLHPPVFLGKMYRWEKQSPKSGAGLCSMFFFSLSKWGHNSKSMACEAVKSQAPHSHFNVLLVVNNTADCTRNQIAR